jgi:hypothetical protein
MAVNRGELEDLIRDLGAIPPAVQKTMRPAVLEAGRPVLEQMKANASWSTRIPGATSMTASSASPGVTFRVNSTKAPHARPIEHDGQAGTFRHPVYGNRKVWVSQVARPFFYRAVTEQADQVAERIGDAVMRVAEQHGF